MIVMTASQKEAWNNRTAFLGKFLFFQHRNNDGAVVNSRVWSHPGSIEDNDGNVWHGGGEFIDFTGLSYNNRTVIEQVSFAISGLPHGAAAEAEQNSVRGLRAQLFDGYVTYDRRIIDELQTVRAIELDNAIAEHNTDTSTVTFYGVSGMTDLTTPTNSLWSKAEQNARLEALGIDDPDIGFDEIARIEDGVDTRWKVGTYTGYDQDNTVQHKTTISGTRQPADNLDWELPRRGV